MNPASMESAVEAMCDSLVNDPDRWRESTHTLLDKRSGIEYWISRGSVTSTWNGYSAKGVFSYDQGVRIYAALNAHRTLRASQAQARVLASLQPRPVQPARNKTATISRFAGKVFLGLLVVCAVLSMAGCKRDDVKAAEEAETPFVTMTDEATGCEYLIVRSSGRAPTPRIAADGKTHLGCKGAQ